MIPKILEYEDRRVKVTAQAFALPELKALIDKYELKVEPYLSYIYSMSAPDSAYTNIPLEEKSDAIIFDIQATLGDFDFEDPLIQEAIDKLRNLYTSPNILLAESLGNELHRIRKKLDEEPLTMGANGNFRDRMTLMKEIGKISTEYSRVRELADKEMRVATKGDHELGGY